MRFHVTKDRDGVLKTQRGACLAFLGVIGAMNCDTLKILSGQTPLLVLRSEGACTHTVKRLMLSKRRYSSVAVRFHYRETCLLRKDSLT